MSLGAAWVAGALVALAAVSAVYGAEEERWIVLIDAGSSGSRAHVHSYSTGAGMPVIAPSKNLKRKPGLSTFADKPHEAGPSLRDLLAFAKSVVPEREWRHTPIHVQATAGLRSLPPHKAQAILESVRDELSRSPANGGHNVFAFRRSWARMISGTQEGLNGWIATNYLAGGLSPPVSGKPPKPLFGLVEMGGFSMQVTFVPADLSLVDPNHITRLRLGTAVYDLYTYSHPTHGLEAAQELFQQTHMDLIEQSGNPCYPTGRGHSATGDYAACAALVDQIMDKSRPACNVSMSHAGMTCAFGGVAMPRITTEQFFAIENFYYTAKFYDLLKSPNPLADLKTAGTAFCGTHWEQLRAKYPKEPAGDLEKYCFSSAYLPRVMEHGLGFERPGDSVQVTREVNGVGIDWALGAVLYEIVHDDAAAAGAGGAPDGVVGDSRALTLAVEHDSGAGVYGGAGGAGVGGGGARTVPKAPANRSALLWGAVAVCGTVLAWLVWRSKQKSNAALLPGGSRR